MVRLLCCVGAVGLNAVLSRALRANDHHGAFDSGVAVDNASQAVAAGGGDADNRGQLWLLIHSQISTLRDRGFRAGEL